MAPISLEPELEVGGAPKTSSRLTIGKLVAVRESKRKSCSESLSATREKESNAFGHVATDGCGCGAQIEPERPEGCRARTWGGVGP